jgi:dienelactone hydrolase
VHLGRTDLHRCARGWLERSSGAGAPGRTRGPGLTDHPIERARRLAEAGYVALALDLYGERDLPIERAKEHVQALRADRVELRSRMRAWLEVLRAHPHVDPARAGALGFCIGGLAVLELARDGAELGCVVAFHPGLDPGPQDATRIRAKVLVCVGERDPIVQAPHRAALVTELAATNVDWQLLVLGGAGHSFTNPGIDAYGLAGFAYHADGDRRAWRALQDLLEEALPLR